MRWDRMIGCSGRGGRILESGSTAHRARRGGAHDFGYLYHADATESDEEFDDEDVLGEDLDANEEDRKPRVPKHAIEIFPEQPVLAVRTVLFDPIRPQELEPHILYVGMKDWGCGSKKTTPKAGQPFRLKRYMVARVLRAFDHRTDHGSGQRLSTKATAVGGRSSGQHSADRTLNCQLFSSVKSFRLYDLDGSGAIEQLATKIRAYWQKHTTVAEE